MLHPSGKLPGRESKRTAKQLPEIPNVKEMFATGAITTGHANAAPKVGPEVVDSDEIVAGSCR